ncbi:MAG: hypothetical protein KDD62_15475, partial [Bdellovibrionales bacterium]|nr:hypothetical protein [Bdellovibrionales bacterium]
LIQSRFVYSTILQGVVFLVHPLTGIYGVLIHFCFCLGRGARVFGLHVGIWLLLVSPMVFWMFSREVGLSEAIDPVWFDLVRLRAPDHVAISNWSFWDSFYTGLTLSLTMALGNKISSVRHFIRWAVVGISLAMLIGYLGSELLPSSAVIRAQFFRATTLLGPLSALVYALFLEKQLQESSRLKIIGSFVIGLTLFGYSPYLHAWFYGLTAFASFGLLVVFVSQSQRLHFSPASLLVTFLIALSAGAFWLRGDFSYRSTADADWRAVQKWAAETTDQAAVFIVPPASTGFRIESERASFGSWFDGTILFFDSATGREWMHRMKLLGWRRENGLPYFFDEYLSESTQIQKLLEDQSLQSLQNVYLVFDRDSREGFFGEALIRFGRYRVYQLKGSL